MRLITDENHVLQGYVHDSIWTPHTSVKYVFKTHPSTSSLGGSEMANCQIFLTLVQ